MCALAKNLTHSDRSHSPGPMFHLRYFGQPCTLFNLSLFILFLLSTNKVVVATFFSSRVTGFHRWAKLFELNFLVKPVSSTSATFEL